MTAAPPPAYPGSWDDFPTFVLCSLALPVALNQGDVGGHLRVTLQSSKRISQYRQFTFYLRIYLQIEGFEGGAVTRSRQGVDNASG